jgi:hypothetical protein
LTGFFKKICAGLYLKRRAGVHDRIAKLLLIVHANGEEVHVGKCGRIDSLSENLNGTVQIIA